MGKKKTAMKRGGTVKKRAGGSIAKLISKTKLPLHKLDAMGMLGAGAAGKAIRKKKKQGYKAREDESLGMRTGREKGKKQSMKDRRNESYGKFGKRPNQKINRRGGGVATRGMGKAK